MRDLVTQTGLPDNTPILRVLSGLTWHVLNPLADAEIGTLGALAQRTDDDLLALPGFGPRRLDALRAELRRIAPGKD
ncbi:DNA-directed RNA polymerase subunit alpha C-terminal domain-containing protein [Sphaerisporangium sp. TRM90804]|uniref:DNA-directed RNA polymerase subunit alpha C-terminal domain-containing protein n=1 Tax=Sphaerisporangium sp. TRM90804 TaxID=3031113 RepID=UPI002448CAC5|nr:DNA-directed RNA polymerase subunit alpha C-terminal domain-containing protein [Sphaerisporangium sp. TRM90804]MDH2425749.1 DNA-directed RNA polymerase subunit alpha C-terminal domain-containing protein [Sphaerisporangium sp. TRM90804]